MPKYTRSYVERILSRTARKYRLTPKVDVLILRLNQDSTAKQMIDNAKYIIEFVGTLNKMVKEGEDDIIEYINKNALEMDAHKSINQDYIEQIKFTLGVGGPNVFVDIYDDGFANGIITWGGDQLEFRIYGDFKDLIEYLAEYFD